MNKMHSNPLPQNEDDLSPEYIFDYTKAKPNRFASSDSQSKTMIVLDEDIAQIFATSEAVNKALRHLIAAMP